MQESLFRTFLIRHRRRTTAAGVGHGVSPSLPPSLPPVLVVLAPRGRMCARSLVGFGIVVVGVDGRCPTRGGGAQTTTMVSTITVVQ